MNDEKIIVSFTTWTKRIKFAAHAVDLMKSQTLCPNKIILNLAIEEFPTKEKELPQDLLQKIDNTFEINWVPKNTKIWKKFIPILNKYPNDVIIPIDDDIEYPRNYIEEMYKGYLHYNKECPIACFKNIRENNVFSHSGAFSLVKKDFFGKYLDEIYNGLILKHNEIHWQSDEVYSYAMWLNGKRYKVIDTINGKKIYDNSDNNKIDAYSNYKVGFSSLMNKIRSLLMNFIKEKYSKSSYDEIFSAPIVVNFTTWKKRDNVVPKMLKHFSEQTLKPKKIVLWLSEEEYSNVIPEHLKKCLEEKLLTDIKFVRGNTYAHKRWTAIKETNNCYNIFIDDDIYYDKNFVKDVYHAALKNQGCAIMWCSHFQCFDENNCRFISSNIKKGKNLQTLSGLSCYPPYTLSNFIFDNEKLRDKWCTKCDDSWIRSFIVKEGIDIVRVYDRKEKTFTSIAGTQGVGVWATENSKKVNNGVMKIYSNFANALICNNAVEKAKEIWPAFNVYNFCSKELLEEINNKKTENAKDVQNKQVVVNTEKSNIIKKENHKVVHPAIQKPQTIVHKPVQKRKDPRTVTQKHVNAAVSRMLYGF